MLKLGAVDTGLEADLVGSCAERKNLWYKRSTLRHVQWGSDVQWVIE